MTNNNSKPPRWSRKMWTEPPEQQFQKGADRNKNTSQLLQTPAEQPPQPARLQDPRRAFRLACPAPVSFVTPQHMAIPRALRSAFRGQRGLGGREVWPGATKPHPGLNHFLHFVSPSLASPLLTDCPHTHKEALCSSFLTPPWLGTSRKFYGKTEA